MATVITEEKLKLLDEPTWFVLFLLAFSDMEEDPENLRRYWSECGTAARSVGDFLRICLQLAKTGAIKCLYKYSKAEYNRYEICCCFDRSALAALLHKSIDRNWWRIFELNSRTGLPLPEQLEYFPGGGCTLSSCQHEATALRALVDATGMLVDFGEMYNPPDLYWRGARALAGLLAPEATWSWPTCSFGRTNPLALHLRMLSTLFARGFDLRTCLAGLAASVADGRLRLGDADLCEAVALSVLAGVAADWSRAQSWEIAPEAKAFAGVGAALREGDLATVHKLGTAANYVILLDPWWNPAVENQAADRAHRIGQRLPVTVYRLIAQDTIEEKVVNLHAQKTALAEDILASGASALSAEAMLALLG